jgi:hypothetical protein
MKCVRYNTIPPEGVEIPRGVKGMHGTELLNTRFSSARCRLHWMSENTRWWALQDSNLRLPPCEGGTLPLS